jgi:YVTN family beta-propeller protein
MGYSFSHWLLTKHARAYSVLSKPEAKQIARLSGIPQEPQESVLCLGCHATGAEAEEWEREETFFVEDGVQCEKCHGPGSEYMDADTMMDPQAARRAGLMIPAKRDCLLCHETKGSHAAIHRLPKLDIDDGLLQIAHPTPAQPSWDSPTQPTSISTPHAAGPKYAGVMACAECHRGPAMGHQFSRWRMSSHALAYARLSSPNAQTLARQEGVEGDPQRSPACLKCHTTAGTEQTNHLESFSADEGVGCEACHGPGSEYLHEAVMIDPQAAVEAGLQSPDEDTCWQCHRDAHGKPFNFEAAWAEIYHPTEPQKIAEVPRYKTPLNLAISPQAKELYVACEASDSVVVIDVQNESKVAEISVGGQPHDVKFSPDGSRVYVSNRLDDSVSVIDPGSRQVIHTIPVGDEPHGILTDKSGEILIVLNTSEDSVSLIDTSTLKEVKRLAASRNPWSLDLSPDGSQAFITNTLSRLVRFRTPAQSEVTVVDVQSGAVIARPVVQAANLLQGVAWHPSGKYGLVTLTRTKNLVPMTRLLQGWTITNGIGIVWRDGRVDQVLLDEPSICFPDPADVAITPDGRLAFVTSSGSDRVAVIDLPKLISMLEAASEEERTQVFPNHLGKPTEFVIKHIQTKNSPRGILITPDGRRAFVANALDDSLTVIDADQLEAVKRIDLGGPKNITQIRYGEQLFHSADITFRRQFSCHTCHPDGHVDGMTYDIEPDGVGVSPVDNRTLRGILDTAPFKWEGTNPSLQRQCGPRLAVFFTRIQPFTPKELSALDKYIATIPRPPNRYRPLGAKLTEAQRRGKKLYERTRTNDGRVIAPEDRCITCHPPPLYTDRSRRDVGTKMIYDREFSFDVPHLNNIYDSAPYLHNGISDTLEEIWTRYNPDDRHGVTNDMTKDQLNDLIEYLRTL